MSNMKFSKLESVPKHFIDTSVVFGAFFEEEKSYEDCKAYLNKLGYNYLGWLSTSVLGEILMILEKSKDSITKELFFRFFDNTVNRRGLKFLPTNFKTFDFVNLIRASDYLVEPLDAEHLGTAVSGNADIFVTLDKDLLENKRLEKALGIRIEHPRLF